MKHYTSITLIASEIDPNGFARVRLQMGKAFSSGLRKYRQIQSVTVDERQMDPVYFLEQLKRDESTLDIYYPMAIQNISSELADRFGYYALQIIIFSLLILLASQLSLLVIAFWWRPDEVPAYFHDPSNNPSISIVDKVANEFSIPLGLLGTITAIWLSLEQPGANFASFGQILGILRFAVFTTVLGFFVKILCIARGLSVKTRQLE